MIDGFEYKDISRLYDKLSRQFHGEDVVGRLITMMGEWLRGNEENNSNSQMDIRAGQLEAAEGDRDDFSRQLKTMTEDYERVLAANHRQAQMVNVAKQKTEEACVREDALSQRLRTMTEDRDEYQKHLATCKGVANDAREKNRELDRLMSRALESLNSYRSEVRELEARLEVMIEEKNGLTTPDVGATSTDEQLFLVWCKSGERSPRRCHTSHDSAMAEAKRLAKANTGHRFYVLYTIGNALAEAPEVQWVVSDERFDDEEGIPF